MSKFNKDALLESVQQTNVVLSNGTKVRVRAFLVREFKLLMMANESGVSINDTIVQVIGGCIVGKKKIDVSTLPIFDLETIYIAIWKLSKGTSIIPVMFVCNNTVTNESGESVVCGTEVKVNVNINKAKLSTQVNDTNIKINDRLSVKMRYPNVLESEYFVITKESDTFNVIMRCIDSVTLNDETMVVGTDIEPSELAEVMDYIDEAGYAKLVDFVSEMPTTTLDIAVKCQCCGHTEPVRLRGLSDFFA